RPGRVPSRPRESQETPLGRDGTRPSQETQSSSPRCTLRKPRPWDCRAPARQRDIRLHQRLRLTPRWYELVLEPPRKPESVGQRWIYRKRAVLGKVERDPVEFHLDLGSRRRPRRPGWNPAFPGGASAKVLPRLQP